VWVPRMSTWESFTAMLGLMKELRILVALWAFTVGPFLMSDEQDSTAAAL
jgi:hypothetical protein